MADDVSWPRIYLSWPELIELEQIGIDGGDDAVLKSWLEFCEPTDSEQIDEEFWITPDYIDLAVYTAGAELKYSSSWPMSFALHRWLEEHLKGLKCESSYWKIKDLDFSPFSRIQQGLSYFITREVYNQLVDDCSLAKAIKDGKVTSIPYGRTSFVQYFLWATDKEESLWHDNPKILHELERIYWVCNHNTIYALTKAKEKIDWFTDTVKFHFPFIFD